MKKWLNQYRVWWIWGIRLMVLALVLVASINFYVNNQAADYCFERVDSIPAAYTGIVLGARVHDGGVPSYILQDRLDVGLELYKAGKISRFLLTGDHGTKSYDEVNSMKSYLIKKGVNTQDVFLDHAGFDTYNSMVRARQIFEVKDAVVITQEFHLPRAVYLARANGIMANGISADRREYRTIRYLYFREVSAKVKAFLEVLFDKDPTFGGEKIPITGDSKKSYDK